VVRTLLLTCLALLTPACATTVERPVPASLGSPVDSPAPAAAPAPLPVERSSFRADLDELLSQAAVDAVYAYSWESLLEFGLAIGAAAPLANTDADRSVHEWYQEKIRSDTTDAVADVAGVAGEFWVTVPIYMAVSLGPGKDLVDESTSEWGSRSLRAMMVGSPMLLFSLALGGHRPSKGDSNWELFDGMRGVSGHTFTGAVPFLTAASMTDDPLCKAALVAGSFAVGWARINNEEHYLSQVVLGWSVAYLAVTAVNESEGQDRCFRLLPTVTPAGPGLALFCEF
jgi:PAP2 superfamily